MLCLILVVGTSFYRPEGGGLRIRSSIKTLLWFSYPTPPSTLIHLPAGCFGCLELFRFYARKLSSAIALLAMASCVISALSLVV